MQPRTVMKGERIGLLDQKARALQSAEGGVSNGREACRLAPKRQGEITAQPPPPSSGPRVARNRRRALGGKELGMEGITHPRSKAQEEGMNSSRSDRLRRKVAERGRSRRGL